MDDVQHQTRAHRILQRALHADRVPHAYIFHGPSGVGREMLATRFARVLLCLSPRTSPDIPIGDDLQFAPADACGHCDSCRLVSAETHPDLHRIYRQLNAYHPDSTIRSRKGIDLSVDVIRHFLIEKAGSKPQLGRAKAFIVRDAELLTNAAQNALLKTLEEPPDKTFIILIVNALDQLLPTTRSRCQPVSFAPLPPDFVTQQLRVRQPDLASADAMFLARFSEGRLGPALLQAEDKLCDLRQTWGKRLTRLDQQHAADLARELQDDAKPLAESYVQREPEASETEAARSALRTLLALNATFYRDLLHTHAGRHDHLINQDQSDILDTLAQRIDSERSILALKELALAESRLERNANPALTIETLFYRLARLT